MTRRQGSAYSTHAFSLKIVFKDKVIFVHHLTCEKIEAALSENAIQTHERVKIPCYLLSYDRLY